MAQASGWPYLFLSDKCIFAPYNVKCNFDSSYNAVFYTDTGRKLTFATKVSPLQTACMSGRVVLSFLSLIMFSLINTSVERTPCVFLSGVKYDRVNNTISAKNFKIKPLAVLTEAAYKCSDFISLPDSRYPNIHLHKKHNPQFNKGSQADSLRLQESPSPRLHRTSFI